MQFLAYFSFYFIFIFIPLNPMKWVWERCEKQQINCVWPNNLEKTLFSCPCMIWSITIATECDLLVKMKNNGTFSY